MFKGGSIICFVALAVFCAAFGATNVAGEAVTLTDDTFFSSVRSGVWLIKFYAPWCPHCKALAPTWDELATKATDFKVAKVDCDQFRTACDSVRVTSFPTIFLFSGPAIKDSDVEKRVQKFSGTRDIEGFLKFVKDNAKPTDDIAEVVTEVKKTPATPSKTKVEDGQELSPSDVPAIDITRDNADDLNSGAWFVEFYAPWCGFCKKLAPIYAEFAETENEKGDFKVAKINCDVEKDLCSKYGVRGFPTLKFFLNGVMHEHVGAQNAEAMGVFARGMIEDSAASSGHVVVLTNNNFERKVLTADGSWMIDFYTPWCAHCKDMAPAWEEFARNTKDNGDPINVGKVECDANEALCERFGINSYPTIKLFQVKTLPSGKSRTVESFQSFWEKYEGSYHGGASDVVILTGENFKSKTKTGLWLIDYYAPWCGHCKQFSPILEDIATASKGNFFVGKIDCEGKGNEKLCEDVEAYPTLLAFKDGKQIGKYRADRKQEMLTDWMESFEDDIPEEDEDVTDVATLTSENWKRRLSEGNWIVDFYAPWCGHCKSMAPVWEELAIVENPAGRVKVGKVDCTRHADICEKYQVESYPTIAFFKNGKEKKPRMGGDRKLANMQNYIDQFVPRSAGNFEEDSDIL